MSGPPLFIQDELRLLKEGLGTVDGHYETFLQARTRRTSQGHSISITIEAFDRQVQHLHGREARVSPGQGPTLEESFYARTFDYRQRLFVGILPHNKTIFDAVLAFFQYYHEEVETLQRLPSGGRIPFVARLRLERQSGANFWTLMSLLGAS